MPAPESRLTQSPVFRGAALISAVFLVFSFLTRLALLGLARKDAAFDWSLAGVFGFGLLYDLVVCVYLVIPWVLLTVWLPSGTWLRRAGRWWVFFLLFLYLAVLLFNSVAEWFFWEEFQVRYNFIAVDYLIWTQEVWGNIRESYPMPLILGALVLVSAATLFLLSRTGRIRWICAVPDTWGNRSRMLVLTAALTGTLTLAVSQSWLPNFKNQYNQELAKNGIYAFGAAFWEMELDYDRFYPTLPGPGSLQRCRKLLETTSAPFLPGAPNGIQRRYISTQPEHRWNVMLICMESLSGELMGRFGNKKGLTPCLDQLSGESLFLSQCYATGTRTVRGMEALTLGLPPTPGQAILYRPRSTGLVTIASPFLERGYDCAFLYGGDGRFDYMNRYFGGNGYRVVDKPAWKPADITFETSWGACDGDLYRKALAEADADHAAGKPFHFFCMTTSNHRPFKYPEGKIDIASGNGRKGAVKYHDYAIGQFLEEARGKPWFATTLFVFCSDHCASSAGKMELDVTKYHIPAMVWNPGLVPARDYHALCSQIDVMPTVLGLLHWTWETRSFGFDLLDPNSHPGSTRAFVSNYQKVALLRPEGLAILQPMKQSGVYDCRLRNGELGPFTGCPELQDDAIAFYQSAAFTFTSGGLSAPK